MLRSGHRVRQPHIRHGIAEKQNVSLQIQLILGRGEVQRLTDLAGTVEKVFPPVGVHGRVPEPQVLHGLCPRRRFQSPQQHGRRFSLRLRDEVQTVVHPVDEIDVGMARSHEQRFRPGRAAVVIGVAGLVAPAHVGLRFRNAARQQLAVPVPHQIRSQQCLRDGNGIAIEEIMGQLRHRASFIKYAEFRRKAVKIHKISRVSRTSFAAFGEVGQPLLRRWQFSTIIATFAVSVPTFAQG